MAVVVPVNAFQSQNGLILAPSTEYGSINTVEFQSQNGLILAHNPGYSNKEMRQFQSQNGLILAVEEGAWFTLAISDFNPKMVWF